VIKELASLGTMWHYHMVPSEGIQYDDVTTLQEGYDYVQYLMEKCGVDPQPLYGSTPISRKRVINGKTYNGKTSAWIAQWPPIGAPLHLSFVKKETTDPNTGHEHLFQTKSGNLFFCITRMTGYWHIPVTMEEALHWARLRDVEKKMKESLGLPTTDIVPASLNVRLPPSLLLRITGLAAMAGVSRQEWIMSKLEEAANSKGEA
jgi:hypothetical protein